MTLTLIRPIQIAQCDDIKRCRDLATPYRDAIKLDLISLVAGKTF